ncbi:MAG: hypothetical protein FWH10_05935, partial [Oscillospiraceae bacterium]|nr:hypothetical protein [Oscillospiraceae bacterium]
HAAHFFEMGIILSTGCLHGENVGVGSILCSNLYHKFAESENIKFTENYNMDIDLIEKYFGGIYNEIIRENAPGSVSKVSKENFYNNLDNIKNIIFDMPSGEELAELLGILDGRTDIGDIEAYNLKCAESEIAYLAFKLAPYIRDRLTLLKLMRCIEF